MKEKVRQIWEYVVKNGKYIFPVVVCAAVAITVVIALKAGGVHREELNKIGIPARKLFPSFEEDGCEDFDEMCDRLIDYSFSDDYRYIYAYWDKYDTYVYAIQYSPNTCVWQGEKCYEIIRNKEFYKFGIHGLWPSYKSGIYLQECNIGEDIEIKIEENKEYFENYFLKY